MKQRTIITMVLAISLAVSGIGWAAGPTAVYAEAAPDGPKTVGSAAVFNELLKDLAESHKDTSIYHGVISPGGFGIMVEEAMPDVSAAEIISGTPIASAPMPVPQAEAAAVARDADFSATNIQVEGVDEADIIKTDGQYIYHLNNGTLNIIKADGKGNMEKISATLVGQRRDDFYPSDMYMDGDILCITGYAWPQPMTRMRMLPSVWAWNNFTKVMIYDISDRAKPEVVREFSVQGYMVSSRKVDNTLYLVVNYPIYLYGVDRPSDIVPLFNDSAASAADSFTAIDFSTMRYFPGQPIDSILIVCGLDVTDAKSKATVESILGSGSIVYMSRSALYVARNDYVYTLPVTPRGIWPMAAERTIFYKFALEKGRAAYRATASEEGIVLNQYSMDEHNGYFRVAMTVDQHSQNSKNTLTIFDPSMNRAGKIDDMAPGERIYSARFMGERAFMVTFRTVDPLFAMDLTNPYNPKVLGELKIPGYSTYLHPYDDNLLIGFGRDTEEMTTIDSRGRVVNTWAVNKGMKLSLFDVSDMTDPKEISVVSIGNEHTHSELLHNPKAWLFSKEKGFVAFPVTHYNWNRGDENEYPAFNGTHVYDISPKGISLRGVISTVREPLNRRGDTFYESTVQRIIYIGDTFYSATQLGIQANEIKDLRFIDAIMY